MNRVSMSLIVVVGLLSSGCVSGDTGSVESTSRPASTTTSSTLETPTTSPAVTTLTTGQPVPESDATVPWIAYQSPDGLRLIRPDGTGSTRALPGGPDGALHPDWSPNGLQLAFAVDEADGTRDIWTANWDGSDAAVLVDCQAPCRDADSPAWSPDGTRIAFNRIDNIDGHNPGSKIQTVEVATGQITTIVATEGAEYAGAQRWSPDGRMLVVELTRFIDDGNDTEQITGKAIAVVGLTAPSPALNVLRPFDSFSTYPDWHPTQDLILFAAGPPDPLDPSLLPQNLFTIRSDGTNLTQITNQGPNDDGLWMPAFRLDGEGILATLVHRPNGNLTLAELQVDGFGIAELGITGAVPGAHPRQRPIPDMA